MIRHQAKTHSTPIEPIQPMSLHPKALLGTALFAALLLSSSWTALAAPPGMRLTAEMAGFSEYTLDNGLRVVLYPDSEKPGAAVNIVYGVGSRHEATGEAGHAHLLEHMLFKGAPGVANVAAEFRSRGIQWNATTAWDRTNYMSILPADEGRLAWVIELEAQRMTSSTFTAQELASEMTVVRNEFERAQSNPYQTLGNALRSAALPTHPYGRSALGTLEQIERVDIERLRAFYKAHYRPDNAVLVVAGNFKTDAVLEHVGKSFGRLPRPAQALYEPRVIEPAQLGPREITVHRVGGVEVAALAFRTPAARHPDRYALHVLGMMLMRGNAGLLHRELVQTQKLSEAAVIVSESKDPSLALVLGVPAKGQGLADARAVLVDAMESGLSARLTEAEMAAAKQALEAFFERAMEQPQMVALMLTEPIAQGDWRLFFAHRDGYAAVTLADVQRVATAYLRSDNRTVGLYRPVAQPVGVDMPEPAGLQAQLAAIRPRQALAAGEALNGVPADLEARVTRLAPALGWRVAVLRKKQKGDAVQVSIVARHSSAQDVRNDFGWDLLQAWVLEGTAAMSAEKLKEAMAALRANGQIHVDPQAVTLRVDAPRQNLDRALELIVGVLTRPKLEAGDFQRLKDARLRSWDDRVNDPGARLELMHARLLNQVRGTQPGDFEHHFAGAERKARLERLSESELRAMIEKRWGTSDISVAAVGDVDAAQLAATAQRLFADWGKGSTYVRHDLAAIEVPGQRHHARVNDRPNASLSAALYLPMNEQHPDRAALQMAVRLLAQGADSVLWKKVRDQLGASYDVSGVAAVPDYGNRAQVSIHATCAPARLDEVLQAIEAEVQRVRATGFDAAHLDRAKRDLLANRQKARTDERTLLGQLDGQFYRRATFVESQAEDQRIAGLTLEQVDAALRKYVDWSKFVVLTAGQVGEDRGLGTQR